VAPRLEQRAAARLYFVTDSRRPTAELEALLEGALAGGADLIQLRDKDAGEVELLEAAAVFRRVADRHGALFLLNDRADLVTPCSADGVHVGQDDMPVAEARKLAGPGAIVGLSSHRPDQLDAALAAPPESRPDYLSVGPVWETPTKQGRPAAGLSYVRYAAERATLPWFAIGGVDISNVAEVLSAGAERIVVVRAIRDAPDPLAAASALSSVLPHPVPGEPS
jgi:thiamine-phosphate pyrophosphorylase